MKPILFNTEMVRVILAGRKTVTRRIVDPDVVNWFDCEADGEPIAWTNQKTGDHYPPTFQCRYQQGDTLWVRETWCRVGTDVDSIWFENSESMYDGQYLYKADGVDLTDIGHWHPSIHMPREAARIFLRVTDVRVERLQDIQERGERSARDEGFVYDINFDAGTGKSAVGHFAEFWESTIKPEDRDKYGWEANPWVWLISFERIEEKT